MGSNREITAVAPAGESQSITALLAGFARGDHDAEARLTPLIYNELRRVASSYMRRERANHTLQTTALVNEAWLRLANQSVEQAQKNQPQTNWNDRVHFFAVASRVMRQILVDHARKKRAGKRGGEHQFQITLQDHLAGERQNVAEVLAINQALDRLAEFDPRAARIVELHFFGGLSFEEMELIVNVGVRTIKRDWSMARAWLHNELSRQS